MPRKGDYRPLPEVPPAAAGPERVGIRRVTRQTRTGKTTVLAVDPGQFGCRRLVGQLADEWVSVVELTRCGLSMAQVYAQAIKRFAVHVDEHADDPGSLVLDRDDLVLASLVREWRRTLPAGFGEGSQRPGMLSRGLTALIRSRAEGAEPVGESILRAASAPHRIRRSRRELDEFSRKDKQVLTRAAWATIRAAEQRLALGRELLASAVGHPASCGWTDPASLLRGLAEEAVTVKEIMENLPVLTDWPDDLREIGQVRGRPLSPRSFRHQLAVALASLLYPRLEDLHAFRLLLVAATGHAPEEITGLGEDDVEFSPAGVRLTMVKARASIIRNRFFASRKPGRPSRPETAAGDTGDGADVEELATHGADTAELIRRLLAMTERARADYSGTPVPLFLQATVAVQTKRLSIYPFDPGGVTQFGEWIQDRSLEVSRPWDVRRMRKTTKVEKAIALRGVVTDIADDHTVATFQGHYAHGTTLHVISATVINQAQHAWLEAALAGPIVLDQAAQDALAGPEAPQAVGLTAHQAAQLRDGTLHMGVTSCRDPFDSPYSRRGDLCAVAPLRCLECRNAFILPSHLPQLLLFADHLNGLRLRLEPAHFHLLWGQSKANLDAVLAERTTAELDLARRQIRDQGLNLQLPLSARTEFDL